MNKDKKKYKKDHKTPSIWDDDVDMEKVDNLPPKEKGRLFPDDYNPEGKPYGDF